MKESHTERLKKVNVWAGIVGIHIVGLFIINGMLNGDYYQLLLVN